MCPLFGLEVFTAANVFWNMRTCTHVSEEITASIFKAYTYFGLMRVLNKESPKCEIFAFSPLNLFFILNKIIIYTDLWNDCGVKPATLTPSSVEIMDTLSLSPALNHAENVTLFYLLHSLKVEGGGGSIHTEIIQVC
jgi:hypothetical protein